MNIANVEAFEEAGKELFGQYGCLPMVAYGKTKISSAFKLLARARNLDYTISNEVSKQLGLYDKACKFAIAENSDDPMYEVEDDVDINDFVEEQYNQLIEDSKQYQSIVVSVAPHPCAHLTYHRPVNELIGCIKVKDKLCAYIDGATADGLNYVKTDLLRVDVVKLIAASFERAGVPVMSVDELIEKTKDDAEVWALYANGFTQTLNQCEREASTLKVMEFKPKNIVELSSFVASIRPGFRSMGKTFWSRTPFTYGIQSLDELLKIDGMTGATAESAFLLYD